MSIPGNGIFVLRGELTNLMTMMKRSGNRWSSHSYQVQFLLNESEKLVKNTKFYLQTENPDKLTKSCIKLKEVLFQIEDLKLIKPNVFLDPFLDVIRSEETTGPITSLALSAINKFLSYGLIGKHFFVSICFLDLIILLIFPFFADPTNPNLAAIVESIADAVTHARFVGADQSSDGVVLLRIIQVLKTLILSPEGSALTNESVCEIIMSCFRICFETRLNELLRRTAEHALRDMILLLFMRLPQFVDDEQTFNIKCLKIRPEDSTKKPKTKNPEDSQSQASSEMEIVDQKSEASEKPEKPEDQPEEGENLLAENTENQVPEAEPVEEPKPEENILNEQEIAENEFQNEEYINSLGVRFTNSGEFLNITRIISLESNLNMAFQIWKIL